MRSIYLLAMNRIPQPNTYKELIEIQVLNGNKLLEKHLSEGPSNAQYTSSHSASVFIEAIDIWVERKHMCSLQESHTLHQGVHTMHYSAELSMSTKVYLVRVGGRKHIMLDTAVPLPWCGKTAGVVSGRCSSNIYVCPYTENAIAVISQIEEMILKNNQIDGRTIN